MSTLCPRHKCNRKSHAPRSHQDAIPSVFCMKILNLPSHPLFNSLLIILQNLTPETRSGTSWHLLSWLSRRWCCGEGTCFQTGLQSSLRAPSLEFTAIDIYVIVPNWMTGFMTHWWDETIWSMIYLSMNHCSAVLLKVLCMYWHFYLFDRQNYKDTGRDLEREIHLPSADLFTQWLQHWARLKPGARNSKQSCHLRGWAPNS